MNDKRKILKEIVCISAISLTLIGCQKVDIKNNSQESTSIIFSENEIEVVGNNAVVEDKVCYIQNGGKFVLAGNSTDSQIIIATKDEVELVLNGVEITNQTGPVIYSEDSEKVTINLADNTDNLLSDGSEYVTDEESNEAIGKGVISIEEDLVFVGTGNLTVNANYKHGICADGSLYIENGNYSITSLGTDGIHAKKWLSINGGELNITAESDMMQSEATLEINGGSITGTSENEGIESKDSITVNGGYINIAAVDDGLNATNSITINDGQVYISTKTGDAIDCNGNAEGCITINGGLVYALGGNAPEGAIDADNASVLINGGTVIAVGDVNSPISENSKQTTVVYGSFNASEPIGILDEDKNTIFSINPTTSGSTMIISVPGMEEQKDYTIYVGGTIDGTMDENGISLDGKYSDGEVSYTFTVDSKVISAGGSAEGMNFGGKMRPEMGDGAEGDFEQQRPEGQMPKGDKPQNMGPGNFDPDNNGNGPNFGDNKSKEDTDF